MFNVKMYWRIWIIVGILIFIGLTAFKGFKLSPVLITSAVSAAGVTLLLEALLFKWIIWGKFPDAFYPWLSSIPYIGGKWEGTIQSDYVFPETGETGGSVPAKLEIKHDFDKIHVILETDKSNSSSYISDIWIDESKRKFLCYTYCNDADINKDINPKHDGTARLRITENEKGEIILEGHYFTGRKTTGKMIFERTSRKNSRMLK